MKALPQKDKRSEQKLICAPNSELFTLIFGPSEVHAAAEAT
jgi:hypothetical protein